MAGNSLGRLMVFLGLDGAEFTRGLTKAEYQAQQFSRNVNSALRKVGSVLGGLQLGDMIYQQTKSIIESAASLNDLADITGSTVEELSRLSNQALIAGTDFNTLQTALTKLSAGMAGTDEESTKAKEALKALGITTRDPVEALQQVAVKLNGYADGVNKVGIAIALFGKQGGQFLATLKDIAELQDVQATVTTKQAQEAEELQKAFARLGVEATGFKNVILSGVVPALTEMIAEMREGTKIAGGFLAAIRIGGGINPFESDVENVRKLTAELGELKKKEKEGRLGLSEVLDMGDLEKRIQLLNARIARAQKRDPNLAAVEDRGFTPQKPEAPAIKADAKAIREKVNEAERYLQALQRQLEGTLDLTAVEQVLRDVQTERFKGATSAQITLALQIAQEIDANKEAKKVEEERLKAEKEIAKAKEDYLEVSRRSLDAAARERDGILQGNDAIREQIIFLQGGQAALDAYDATKREAIALEKEHMADMLAAVGAGDDLVATYRDMAAALRQQNDVVGQLRFAEALKREAEAVANLKGQIFDVVGYSIEDLIVNEGKASDVLKALEKDLVRFITSQAMAGLKDLAMGGNGGGVGNLFGFIASLIGGGGLGYGSIGSAIPPGPFPYANGTNFHPGGMAIVGERGPELVNLPRGSAVHTAADTARMLGGRSITVNAPITVQGNVDSRTARQIAREIGAAVGSARGRG